MATSINPILNSNMVAAAAAARIVTKSNAIQNFAVPRVTREDSADMGTSRSTEETEAESLCQNSDVAICFRRPQGFKDTRVESECDTVWQQSIGTNVVQVSPKSSFLSYLQQGKHVQLHSRLRRPQTRFAGQLGADLTYIYCCTAPATNCHRLAKIGMRQQGLNRTENDCERTFRALFTADQQSAEIS
jgi:hypothetical protein